MVSRREFMVGCGVVAASALIDPRRGIGEPAAFTQPLPIPRLVDAAGQRNAIKLTAARGRHSFHKGKPTSTYGYSGPVLGPVLRLRRGDTVQMTVENALDVPTTVHWHGLLVPGEADGGPQQVIPPGGAWTPRLTIDQPAATAWYHPHLHRDTGRQVYMGLAGMIMIDDGSDAELGLPRRYGVDDLPIILQDRSFGADGALDYDTDPLSIVYGTRGDTIIVNGVVAPTAKVPPGWVRLRILNGANAQNFELRFRDQRTFYVIASDSGFLAAPAPLASLRISPAERFEILVDFSDKRAAVLETGPDQVMGIFGAISSSGGDYVAVMRFVPTARAPAVIARPTRLVVPRSADPAGAVRRRQFVLNNGVCRNDAASRDHSAAVSIVGINGKTHDLDRIDVETVLGTSEIWEIVSVGMAHPFHVHGASFRILSLDGNPPPAHLAGWKDVALVEEKAELLVAFNRPATREHPFMYHCHVLEHEDAGMMGQYTCAPA